MQKLLLIDGNNLFHRAYHALPPLSDKTGENSNAVFGFSNMIIKAIGEVKPTHIACAFDTKAPTFRHVEFEAYKAQRVAPPPDLYPQLPKVKRVLDAFGIKYFEKAGFEADDLLASIAKKCLRTTDYRLQQGRKTVDRRQSTVDQITILSGDRDLLQLVDGNIKVQAPGWNLKETTLYGAAEVKEKYGLEPHQMIDYKSLVGDPSDNIPGISGIGPKTAAGLLQKYHTLEKLFDHIDDLPDKVAGKLRIDKDKAVAAKKLVALDTTIDLDFDLDDLEYKNDNSEAIKVYEELGFKSIASKLKGTGETSDEESNQDEKPSSDQLELI